MLSYLISKGVSSLCQDTHGVPQVQHLRVLLQYIPNFLADTARVNDNLVTELVHPLHGKSLISICNSTIEGEQTYLVRHDKVSIGSSILAPGVLYTPTYWFPGR